MRPSVFVKKNYSLRDEGEDQEKINAARGSGL